MTRLALLTEIAAPYRIPLFNALADRLDLRVVFLRGRNPERPYGLHADELRFAHTTLPGTDLTILGRWLVLNGSVARHLRGCDAVLVGGWNQPAFWQALAWCRLRRVPAILWVESTGSDRRSGRLERAKTVLLRSIAAFVVPGSASREYLLRLGVSAERIAVAPNAVDPAIFGGVERSRRDGRCRLIAVGRLAREKAIDTLLEAVRDLPVDVTVVGAGPEEPRLRRLAGWNVTFTGHVDRDALPALYADADVAVMPSRSEPWGMVLNEAALAGLPLVSTPAAGAALELIQHGVNGFLVPPDDVPALRQALRLLVADDRFRHDAGRRSRELAAGFTPDGWAAAVASAVEAVVQ